MGDIRRRIRRRIRPRRLHTISPGDDDVWIFIDGTLVGDLGGIHDATSIEINFATGDVIVYNDSSQPDTDGYRNNKFDEGETIFSQEKIGRLLGYNANTLPDNTYHTLNFFYLERGNTDSNLSLKYNLVTIPETDIYKVDQDEKLVAGATFKLYYADSTTGKTNRRTNLRRRNERRTAALSC